MPPKIKTIRAFIALNLPIDTVRKLAELQGDLRQKAADAGLKVGWVKPPNIHPTLKFLGNITEESAWAIRDLLPRRLSAHAPLTLDVSGLGAFPSQSKPRVLWVGLHPEPEGALSSLAADVDSWMAELGFDPEKRPFKPHITLGRVKQGAAEFLTEMDPPDLGTCTAQEVVLYKSVLQRTGAEYTPLVRVQLTP